MRYFKSRARRSSDALLRHGYARWKVSDTTSDRRSTHRLQRIRHGNDALRRTLDASVDDRAGGRVGSTLERRPKQTRVFSPTQSGAPAGLRRARAVFAGRGAGPGRGRSQCFVTPFEQRTAESSAFQDRLDQ